MSLPLKQKIVYLISPPRSLSVAFTRMMEAYGTFKIIHEPFVYPYGLKYHPAYVEDVFNNAGFPDYELLLQHIVEHAKLQPVFIKEMSFAFADFIKEYTNILHDPDVYFIILARNPHHSLLSLYLKKLKIPPADIIGYEELYNIFCLTQERAFNKPLLILAEDLYQQSEYTFNKICNYLKIPYNAGALNWTNLGNNFTGQAWLEIKKSDLIYHWHGDALQSTQFVHPRHYDLDEDAKPTFLEITNEDDRVSYQILYQEALCYYQKILSF